MKNSYKTKVVLLDVHAILHRAFHALPGFATSKGEPTGALFGLTSMLLKIAGEIKPDYVIACYDLPGPTFRKQMYEEYKAGRPKADEELVDQLVKSRELFNALNIPYYEKPGFEADDLLGTISSKLSKEKEVQTIIATGDLDALQLVNDDKVVVYTLRKGIKDTVIYNEAAVVERFGFGPKYMADYKGLRGDPSDNIIGVKGVGEKTAETLIQNFKTIEAIYDEIKKHDGKKLLDVGVKERMVKLLADNKEEAMFSKTLATIKCDVPIDFSLPSKTWRESVDIKKASDYFTRLEFKSLKDRMISYVAGKPVAGEEVPVPAVVTSSASMFADTEGIGEKELREIVVGLWLLDSNNTSPTLEDVYKFSGVRDFEKSKIKIPEEIKRRGLEKIYYDIELPLIPIIKAAEDRGILVDGEYLKKLSVKFHKETKTLEENIYKIAGQEFNINSTKQLSEILFSKLAIPTKGLKKTPGGVVSTRESELEKIKEAHPIISEILSYRELQKLLTTYIDNIPLMLDGAGRLHAHLNQTGTTTGRMSSDSPNLQNIPAREGIGLEVRRAFVAAPGYKLVSLDYSQIEMRVLAWLSSDPDLIDIFKKGLDVHSAVASRVFGVDEKDVTKDMRRKAKVINFGIIYGMGVNALKKNLGSTMKEAQEFHENYFKKFPKVKEFFDGVKEQVRKLGYTTTFYGRRRYLPDIKSYLPYLRATAERMAMNAPLQGTATADLIKKAMKKVDGALRDVGLDKNTHLLVQVHDELLYEIKDDKNLDKAVEIIKEGMESIAPECPVPLTVHYSVGNNWGELK
ncbi:MAG: DNA polymerase [Candidatus Paceibacterota bacterium]